MARKDDLALRYPEFNITLLDVLSCIDSTGKNKYLEVFCRIWQTDLATSKSRVLSERSKVAVNKFATPMEQKFATVLLDTFLERHLETLQNFIAFNERGLVAENDVSKYHNIEKVKVVVDEIKEALEEKELEKEIIKIFENSEWLVVRPLSWKASAKYGANTKWCTTFTEHKSHFRNYSKSGPLIYVINKKSGYKLAFHRDIKATPGPHEIKALTTIWNAEDKKIDLMDSELSLDIIDIVRKEIKTGTTNWDLTSFNLKTKVNREVDGKNGFVSGESHLSDFHFDLENISASLTLTPREPGVIPPTHLPIINPSVNINTFRPSQKPLRGNAAGSDYRDYGLINQPSSLPDFGHVPIVDDIDLPF